MKGCCYQQKDTGTLVAAHPDYRTAQNGRHMPMVDGNIVHVVGTGTIGEPLIGLLCDAKEDLEIDEVTFYKHSPVLTDRPKVKGLINRGSNLAVSEDKVFVLHERPITGLDVEEFEGTLNFLSSIADDLDNQFADEFGAKIYSQQMMGT